MHDAMALVYVREKRGEKYIQEFGKVNCWFVNNAISHDNDYSDTEYKDLYSCKKHQPDSPDSVNIKREGNGDGQQTVFGHMGSLPYIKLDMGCLLGKLIRAFSCGEYFIFCFYDLIADFITQGTGNFSGLCGKRVDHAHHQDRRCKRKRF